MGGVVARPASWCDSPCPPPPPPPSSCGLYVFCSALHSVCEVVAWKAACMCLLESPGCSCVKKGEGRCCSGGSGYPGTLSTVCTNQPKRIWRCLRLPPAKGTNAAAACKAPRSLLDPRGPPCGASHTSRGGSSTGGRPRGRGAGAATGPPTGADSGHPTPSARPADVGPHPSVATSRVGQRVCVPGRRLPLHRGRGWCTVGYVAFAAVTRIVRVRACGGLGAWSARGPWVWGHMCKDVFAGSVFLR